MLEHLLVDTATLQLPNGTYTADGQPNFATGVSCLAKEMPMTKADRDAFGTVEASTIVLLKSAATVPVGARIAIGGRTYDVKGVRKCMRLGSATVEAWRCAV